MSRIARRPSPGLSIGDYLIRRLRESGVRDVFGVPGDYVLSFYAQLESSPLRVVGCTREDCAGFAADAYARINGIGAVCVTYCVGGLSLCNSIAGAYAEKSAGGGHQRLAGPAGALQQSPPAPQGEGFQHPVRGLPPPLRRRRRAGRSANGLRRDRPRAGRRAPLSPAGLHRAAPRHGPHRAGGPLHADHPGAHQRSRGALARRWPRPCGGSPPPAGR